MKKILCLILAAAFLLLTGCQAKGNLKTYTTDELIQKIEKEKKNIKSDEDRKNIIYVVKTVAESESNLTSLSEKLGCFVEKTGIKYTVDYRMSFTDKITVKTVLPDSLSDEYSEVTVIYDSQTDYLYSCENKSWTIEMK